MPTKGTPLQEPALDRSAVVAVVIVALMGAAIIYGIFESERSTAAKMTFFRECIEFHSLDRCQTLWWLDRLDLGRKP